MNRIAHHALLIAVFAVFMVIGAFADDKQAPVVFDLGQPGHAFQGFGVQIWSGDISVEPVLRDLKVTYVRMAMDLYKKGSLDVSGWSDADYAKRSEQIKRDERLRKTRDLLGKHHIRTIATAFGVPSNWKQGGVKTRALAPEYYLPFAKLVASTLVATRDAGVDLYGVEPFNEPDGNWSCRVPPPAYNQVVKLLRQEMDERGLGSVLIVGPGVAHIDTGEGEKWIDALDVDAVKCLGAWSIHGYQWDKAHAEDLGFIRACYERGFQRSLARKDPLRAKPVIITEYAPLKVFRSENEAVELPQFSARAVLDALSFYNCGANVVLYWEAADMAWSPERLHGLIRLDKTPRPTYFALQSVFAHWPVGGRMLRSPEQAANDVYAAAVLHRGTNSVVVSVVNCTDHTREKLVQLRGALGATIIRAQGFEDGKLSDRQVSIAGDGRLTVILRPHSVLTCVVQLLGPTK